MLLPAEIEAKSLIPAIRAILAKKLTTEYKMKEEVVAKVLGVTQAAISNYIRGTRGDLELIDKLSSINEIMRKVDDIAQDLVSNRAYTPGTMAKFVELCNFMRYSFDKFFILVFTLDKQKKKIKAFFYMFKIHNLVPFFKKCFRFDLVVVGTNNANMLNAH